MQQMHHKLQVLPVQGCNNFTGASKNNHILIYKIYGVKEVFEGTGNVPVNGGYSVCQI